MKSGIYSIINTVNGRQYIGQSIDIENRIIQHKRSLNGNYHKNAHLQSAWNLYKQQSFEFVVLIICEFKNLTINEQFFIDEIGFEKLYNICPASESRKGAKLSVLSIKKMSESKKGGIPWNKGKTKKDFPQMSKSGVKIGNKPSNIGTHLSEATKAKLSLINKGKTMSKETRSKISKTMKGKKINPHNYRNRSIQLDYI